MSPDTPTESDEQSDAQPRAGDEAHATEDTAAPDSGASDAESDGTDEQERDDHRVDVTLTLDNSAAADVGMLRDAGVDVSQLLAQALERAAEGELHKAKQQAKYGQQGRQRGR